MNMNKIEMIVTLEQTGQENESNSVTLIFEKKGIHELIRCKNCRYWWKDSRLCLHEEHCDGNIACMECGENDFCSRAERKGCSNAEKE